MRPIEHEYIARAQTVKVQDERVQLPTRLLAVALLARDMMRDDEARFKQGYTFANAVNFACDVFGVNEVIRVAMVAERLHGMLIEEAALA